MSEHQLMSLRNPWAPLCILATSNSICPGHVSSLYVSSTSQLQPWDLLCMPAKCAGPDVCIQSPHVVVSHSYFLTGVLLVPWLSQGLCGDWRARVWTAHIRRHWAGSVAWAHVARWHFPHAGLVWPVLWSAGQRPCRSGRRPHGKSYTQQPPKLAQCELATP